MQLKNIIEPVLLQLSETLCLLTNEQFCQKSSLLNGSSIGGHTRHIIELFQCLLNGYDTAEVNYELRKRDSTIETNKIVACEMLGKITDGLGLHNKQITLQGFFGESEFENFTIDTNYYRELIYNLEHTIHHMALIRVAINEVSNITLAENFGVASSTTQFRKACAQ
jgi:hypothetical protein